MNQRLLISFCVLLLFVCPATSFAQKSKISKKHSETVKKLYDEALLNGEAYENLRYLCKEIGPRLSGSPAAAAAVDWGKELMLKYDFDTVWLQPVMVPHWIRGEKEIATAIGTKKGDIPLTITALGNSVGTGSKGISAEVIEVKDFDDLKALGEDAIKGKIVFFNRPMDNALPTTFTAYGEGGFIRFAGPSEAGIYGAVGCIVRSLSTETDDFPHTGSTTYKLNAPKIPAVAVSTLDADMLSELIEQEKEVTVYLETHCEMKPEKLSYNVIGEIKGKKKPNEVIVVGGHLDSWDLAEGAQDDGAGVVQSLEVLRLYKSIGYQPKHTIRAVFFMNEENGLRGGKAYAKWAEDNSIKHICAMESDAGGFSPRGFTVDTDEATIEKMQEWIPLFLPYGVYQIEKGYGGADVSPLKNQQVPTMELHPDSQRYFVYHHSALDTFDKVNRRELHLGAASMASLIYMIDQEGL